MKIQRVLQVAAVGELPETRARYRRAAVWMLIDVETREAIPCPSHDVDTYSLAVGAALDSITDRSLYGGRVVTAV